MKNFFPIIILFLFAKIAFATHMRAGEITYEYKSGLTYKITIVTYTFTPSPADRPSYDISWGDGTTSTINRNEKINMPDEISRNTYEGEHTYPGPDTYVISLEDPNRNGGILNIPESVNVPFYIQTILVINPFLGTNSSPVLLNPPIDNGCVGVPFIHNPGAYDINSDSISYKLINCKGEGGLDIPLYSFPFASNSLSINPITGDLLWDSPTIIGEYNVAILIQEWRHGQLIGSITRDMQISITTCNNHPPVIDEINDTCVLAGTLLKFTVKAKDPDIGDVVTLTATGGPLLLTNNPASFQSASHLDSVSSIFSWQTNCDHVKQQPYQMTFRAMDNGTPVHLIDIESVQITIIAPAPENLIATPVGNNIQLTWNQSPCQNAIGYKIYRRNGFYGYVSENCVTGVPAYTGYVQIANVGGVSSTSFTDTNNGIGLVHGIDYCYMIIAYFSDGAESYASNETCTTLIKNIPIITNVSINNTDAINGSVFIAWSKPTVLDTIQIPGPFKYFIYRSPDFLGNNLVLIDSLEGLNDTTFVDTLINTVATPWSYRIELWNNTYNNRYLIGFTQKASSIFLTLTPSDNQLLLKFLPVVPWINDTFIVYRQNFSTLVFDSIGYSYTSEYTDKNLANGTNYCYKIKSIGNYFAPGLIDPIINYSQETCGSPIDQTPPCPPHLFVIPDCEKIENLLVWSNKNDSCANDIISYNIYYSPVEGNGVELIKSINAENDTAFLHQNIMSIAGCYYVTAVDSFLNESIAGNTVCLDIDSCDIYKLPNVFTPNGDGVNDYFIPFPYHFVEKIYLQIFNRWGQIVYTTENPDINWNGKDKFSNLDCSDGVYFYVCDVYEIRLAGLKKRTINGSIHLYRNK
ncbi:MAG: gliding motility-associated C-terminal domain-containing protein [Bacteroidetes bacterium]|nr:gliding motility-associated C-terminal domain-containing protein [Bacteroidota bacterium]